MAKPGPENTNCVESLVRCEVRHHETAPRCPKRAKRPRDTEMSKGQQSWADKVALTPGQSQRAEGIRD